MDFIKLFIFCGCISFVNGIRYSGKFTTVLSTWSNARLANKLVGYGLSGNLSDILVTVEGNSYTYGWIEGLSAYQPWFEYLGCYVISNSKVKSTWSVDKGDQVLDCVKSCSSTWSYFGLQQNKCVCLDIIVPDTSDVISQCTSNFCTDDTYAFCASDNQTLHQYAVYKRSPEERSIRSGVGGCLVLTIKRSQSPSVYYETASCSTGLRPLCFKNGRTYYYTTGTNWNGAVDICKSASTVMASPYMIAGSTISTPDGSYWLAQIRKSQFYLIKDFITGFESFCLAARVKLDGHLDIIERFCDSTLPGLYYTNIIGMPDPGDLTTARSNTTADSRGTGVKKEKPPLSEGLIATVVFIPSMVVVSIVAVVGWFVYRCGKCCNQNRENTGKFVHFEPTSSCEVSEKVSEMTSKTLNVENEYYEPDETYYVIGSDTYTEVKDSYCDPKVLPLNNAVDRSYVGVDQYAGSSESDNYNTLTRDKHACIDMEAVKSNSNQYHTLTRGINLADATHGEKISTYDRMSSIRRAKNNTDTSGSLGSLDSLHNASGIYDTVVLNEDSRSNSKENPRKTDNYDNVQNDIQPQDEDDQYDHLDNAI